MSKKIKKLIKPRKLKKNNQKNRTVKKNRLQFWKNWSVRFRFYKPKTEKTEPNRKKNEPKPVWTSFCPKKPNRTEPKPVGFFFKTNFGLVTFFDKNRIEPKMITPTKRPTNIFNFGVGKYHTNPKNTILLTLASVNIFAKDEFEEEIFYVIFSCLSFIIICPF